MSTTVPTESVLSVLERVRVHDVDTHISEPPDLWTSRLPSRWADAAPRPTIDPSGAEIWHFGDKEIVFHQALRSACFDELTQAGALEPKARLKWMDANGVYSQVMYPNLLGFYPRAFIGLEPALGIACVQAYNDFQTEFASVDPKRLIPIANLPWWDLDAAVLELNRCYGMGHRGMNFGWQFEQLGLPRLRDDHWEPLLKRAQEMDLSVNFHVGFNSDSIAIEDHQKKRGTPLDHAADAAILFTGNLNCVAEIITGGICHRYPSLKFVSVESGIGYLPFLLEALDWQFLNNNLDVQYPELLLPSEYFRRQVYACFWFERDIVQLAELYPDNFMFETDFPHRTSLTPGEAFPHIKGPRETIIANLAAIPETTLVKLIHDNAAKVYHLD
jgi:predicted TIM-barrel fold metal-dependent hydrolase